VASLRFILPALWSLLCASTFADERILEFDSDIRIAAAGGMTVTETIRVRAEGSEIRRGIFRDFPTDYRDRLGNRYRVGFDVLSVMRDGRPEPYFQERRSNGVRVYIGDADTFLPAAEYVYQLRYATDRQLGFFADHDELYWNVTGNGWGFPIDRASARVSLPTPVAAGALAIEGYVGPAGSTDRSYVGEIEGGSSARIRSSRALQPSEGLTLVMTWPKGVIAEPTAAEKAQRLLKDNAGLLIALVCCVVTGAYFVSVWRRFGRDPERGVIFPHYQPPENISPASARHVSRMGYDGKAFTAAIINLAVKGYLEIDESDEKYTLRSIAGGKAPLAPGERVLLDTLFAHGDSVLLDNANHGVMLEAISAHGKSLKRDNYRIYFVTNSLYVLPAILIVVVAAIAIGLFARFSVAVVIVLIATLLMVPLFAYLLKAPTKIGRRLLDKIEGFKLYLEVAEKDELELKNPPEKTPALFEAYLPYALALGVEQRWAEKFNGVFERLRADTGQAYAPGWYHGHWASAGTAENLGSMTATMAGDIGSAISSAATPPGSSSGSGGGGSSGGGGGGGGGGGW
jgi:uncharacterized membrane protein YgcG